jgi:hypothetical protein
MATRKGDREIHNLLAGRQLCSLLVLCSDHDVALRCSKVTPRSATLSVLALDEFQLHNFVRKYSVHHDNNISMFYSKVQQER